MAHMTQLTLQNEPMSRDYQQVLLTTAFTYLNKELALDFLLLTSRRVVRADLSRESLINSQYINAYDTLYSYISQERLSHDSLTDSEFIYAICDVSFFFYYILIKVERKVSLITAHM